MPESTTISSREARSPAWFDGPLFDAHVHYEEADAAFFSPQQLWDLLQRSGVRSALVSSIPDENSLLFCQHAPLRGIPLARPFDDWKAKWTWQADPAVGQRVAAKLDRAEFWGIGEFNLRPTQVMLPGTKAVADLARQRGLLLHAELGDQALEGLLAAYPGVRVLWAHAGIRTPSVAIGRMLERHANLWVELAQRFDVAPNGRLGGEWRRLFEQHSRRFLVGSGSSERRILRKWVSNALRPAVLYSSLRSPRRAWMQTRWQTFPDSIAASRRWLAQLPASIVDQIAFGNAEQLFPEAAG